MADFKNMTVQALRELARKALGRGHTQLKTKAELVSALQAAERKLAGVAERAATTVKKATGRAARATERVAEKVRKGRAKRVAAKAEAKAEKPAREAEEREEAPRRKPRSAGRAGTARPPKPAAGTKAKPRARTGGDRGPAASEPDPDGYMVARVAGEDALRIAPHPMTESAIEEQRGRKSVRRGRGAAAPLFEEDLGELPWSYADDTLVLLPRDPTTAFLYWDHASETLRAAWEGLDGGRAQIWLFLRDAEGAWSRIRALDFALESRSYYLHDLEPGRVYRAEIHVVDRRGRDRLIPRPSNEMMLPPVGPSPIVDDRFMRLPWSEPLQQILRDAYPGGPFSDEVRAQLARLSDWSRFAGRVWGGSAGGIGGRPGSPTSSPSSPSSAQGLPWNPTDGEGN